MSVSSSKYQYSNIRRRASEASRRGDFQVQEELLEEMIKIIEWNTSDFDEPKDRIRELRCRILVARARAERLHGGKRWADLILNASRNTIPHACLASPCDDDNILCAACNNFPTLSARQQRMCGFRARYMVEYLKVQAAWYSLSFRLSDALQCRRKFVTLVDRIGAIFSDTDVEKNYFEYWLAVTEGAAALLDGQFDNARYYYKQAFEKGSTLDRKKCFPNFFVDVQEIFAHREYVSAIENIACAKFSDARDHFRSWITIRNGRKGFRYENISIFCEICGMLANVHSISDDNWRTLERLLENRYVARSTWVLWRRLQAIRYDQKKILPNARPISNNVKGRHSFVPEFFVKSMNAIRVFFYYRSIRKAVRDFSYDWRLFVPEVKLLGEDRSAGLMRDVIMPSFLDVFDFIDHREPDWKGILRQNLRSLLVLMAEYEYLRHRSPPYEEAAIPKMENPPLTDEWSSQTEIIKAIQKFLDSRPGRHEAIFGKALNEIDRFEEAVNTSDFRAAIEAQKRAFDIIRSWPHVIKVIDRKQISSMDDSEELNFLAYQSTVERLWTDEPKQMIIEGAEKLEIGRYYFIRPRWNIRRTDYYRVRHERFHESRTVKWMEIFFNNTFKATSVNTHRFREWILQFDERERFVCLKLFSAMRIYDKERMVNVWNEVYQKLPSHVLRGIIRQETIMTKLGHSAKSGSLSPYSFRQAMTKDPQYKTMFAGTEKYLFRDLSQLNDDEWEKVNTVIFLDDFIGTGGQAKEFIEWYFPRFPYLSKKEIFLCTVTGFETAVNYVANEVRHSVEKFSVIVGDKLRESDRAFSEDNSLWLSKSECEYARQWAEKIGEELISGLGYPYETIRDRLGWKGCEALIAFEHNIPSDTLPIFWSQGSRGGEKWKPLFERYD